MDSEGYLTYTTDSSDFAAFEFTDDSKMALQWVSTISSADLTLGQVYPIYAMASGSVDNDTVSAMWSFIVDQQGYLLCESWYSTYGRYNANL